MKTIVVGVIFIALLLTNLQSCVAKKLSPYASGYLHGMKDPELKDIETPRKGPMFHTNTFDQDDIDGWCSHESPSSGSDSENGTFQCDQDATQYKNTTVR